MYWMHECDHADDQQRRNEGALRNLLEVPLAHVSPKPFVDAEAGEHDQRQRHHPPDRVVEQVRVSRFLPRVGSESKRSQ